MDELRLWGTLLALFLPGCLGGCADLTVPTVGYVERLAAAEEQRDYQLQMQTVSTITGAIANPVQIPQLIDGNRLALEQIADRNRAAIEEARTQTWDLNGSWEWIIAAIGAVTGINLGWLKFGRSRSSKATNKIAAALAHDDPDLIDLID